MDQASVGKIFSEIIYSIDRFILANMISIAAVAYYITPFDLLHHALMEVMFPALNVAFLSNNKVISFINIVLFYTVEQLIINKLKN